MTLILLIVFLGIVFFLFALPKNQEKSLETELRPYIAKNPLTATETVFYHKLIEALPEYVVLAQVQLSSFLKVDQSQINWQSNRKWFGHISQQSIDFLVCTKQFSIIAAIELDDKTHYSDDAVKRDYKKSRNLEAAKVPLIRWHAEAMPEIEIIKHTISQHFSYPQNMASSQPEWLADGQQAFFKRAQNQASSTFIQVIFLAVILIGIVIWGKSEFSKVMEKNKFIGTPNIQQSHQKIQANPYQEQLEKQKRDQALLEQIKIQNALSQQLLTQQQDQQKLLNMSEEARKEAVWNRDYKKSVECGDTENAVTCGNRYIYARRKFEQYWEAKSN